MKNPIPVTLIAAALLLTSTTDVRSQSTQAPTSMAMFVEQIANYKGGTYSRKWESITEKDILFRKRVCRTIDVSENEVLRLTLTHPSIGKALIDGVLSGAFKAYSATDDKFTTQQTLEMLQSLHSSGVSGNEITSLEVKEDWFYLKEEQKMIVQIVSIGPVIDKERANAKPIFWVYYPEARPYFTKQLIAASGTQPSNLDEVFEGRYFTSKIK